MTETTTGLQKEHKNQFPIFEKKYTPPGGGKELVSRLYKDGSLYYLTDNKDEKDTGNFKPAWGFISSVYPEGVKQIEKKLSDLCNQTLKQKDKGNAPGATSWKYFCDGKLTEIIVRGIPENEENVFLEIDQLISSNMSKIP